MSFVATIEADINKWGPNLDKAGKDINSFANNAKRDLDKVSKAQKGAGTVAMEFNRIIQDAPFGMMGISNNLTQLTDNYKNYAQNVRQAALEQGKAISNFQIFKGAVAGILSPINLFSLGLSVVTSGIMLYTQWQQRAKTKTAELASETKKYTDDLKKFIDTLDSVTKARLDGEKSANREIITVNSLRNVIENESISRQGRLNAINQLKQLYPGYFKNMSNEILLAGQAESAYKRLTTELLNSAKARAAERQIAEEADKILDITEKRYQRKKEEQKLERENLKLVQQMNKEGLKPIELTQNQADNVRLLQKFGDLLLKTNNKGEQAQIKQALNQARINELRKEGIADSTNEIKSVQAIDRLQSSITTSISDGGKLVGDIGGAVKEIKDNSKQINDILNSLTGSTLSEYDRKIFDIEVKYQGIFKAIQDIGGISKQENAFGLATQAKQFELLNARAERFIETTSKIGTGGLKGLTNNVVSIPIEAKVTADFSNLNNQLSGVRTTIQTLVLDLQSVVGNGISDMMSTLGNTIANGGNWLEGIGKGILSAMGGLAKSIGEQMIAFGVAGLALKKLMLNPFLSIAAGAALVALGSFASSSIGSQTSNFNGTNASSYGSSINSSQSFIPRGAYYNNDKQVVDLKIKGNNLVGSLNINQNRNNRLG